jgi:tripeptide aminopeptidase
MSASQPTDADRIIAEAREICAVPAPTFAEGPRGDLVARMLSDAGARPARDEVGNVIAELGEGPAADALILAAHLDTVFDADTEIVFHEQDGRLAAPGLGDNSFGVAAIVHLARRLHPRRLTRRVVLAATVGEEGLGDLRGAKALLDERECGAFIAVEGQMLNSITIAAAGSLRFRLTVSGPGGHPWSDRDSPSAIHGLIGPLTAIVQRVRQTGVVVNVGVIRGGTVINAIATEASAELDLRSEDETALRAAARIVEESFAGLRPGLQLHMQPIGHRPAGRIDSGHPLLAAARAARQRAGLPPVPEIASSTDANAAHGRGIPAITVGVTTGGNAHRLDEYVDLPPVAGGLAALDILVDELVGDPTAGPA